ncbi:MAG TPA: pentapeptide repeat-containing protein, partial [Devosiaceae bacterium]|nr:pentapeptide repeat-containing protein [Devosiaceae bacterium]
MTNMPDPDHAASLTHIGELSKNARSIWFGLLGLITFVGVTLMGHRDADFFAVGADTKLPLIGIEVPVTYFFATAFKREATERYAEYTSQLDAPDLHGSDLRNARMAGAFLPGANFRNAEMQGAKFFGAQMQGARLGGAQMQGTYLGSADMNGADCSNTRDRGVLSLRGALLNFADVSCDHLTQAHLDGAVGNSGTVLPRG